ncbi:unnamed protein product [Hapterophycus canaliculatus]
MLFTLRSAASTSVGRRWALASSRTLSAVPTKKKTIQQLARETSLKGQAVLVRADLNLPRNKETGEIVDDTRARAVIPTVKFLLKEGAKVHNVLQ